jgi:mono/diheme cytochrome c family protein
MKRKRLSTADGRLLAVSFLFAFLFSFIYFSSTMAQEPVLPQSPPDAAAGLDVFADRCANCHGPAGEGDGEMASNLPAPPADFSEPAFRRTGVPAEFFNTITNGLLDQGMPPFGPGASSNPISEANRWHLVAAVYSLSTATETVEEGQAVYEENCVSCHGAEGTGDGPAAADLETSPPDLSSLSYWFNRSNETVFTSLESGRMPAHDYELSEEERWAVVDYARTFSYAYVDPAAPLQPIEEATINGQVVNGTTDETVTEGTVLLRAFTQDLEETLSLTTTLSADGRYGFNLTSIQPDWVFLATVPYNGLNFSSDVTQLNRSEPEAELPVTVYEQTTDPDVVQIEQIHIILDFIDQDRLQIVELYAFSNEEDAVFMGETGRVEDGTIEFVLPDGAENVDFQRAFDSLDSFIPATELIETESGWADTIPLRPGQGSTNLVVQYELPYRSGMTISHPVRYNAASATLVMPDVGVTPTEGEWVGQGARQMQSGTFVSYARSSLAAGSRLSLALNGRPQRIAGTSSGASLARDNTTELIIGGSVLLVVLVAAVYFARAWQMQNVAEPVAEEADEANTLLHAIATLDEAYENGEIGEDQYRRQRKRLKSELTAIWSEEQ